MLKKTITYTDYSGIERTEDFYFNLSKAEILEMQLSVNGGFAEMLQKIIKAKDFPTLVKTFKELILMSYGEKSEDGRRFVKSKEISDAFAQTEAYSILFMELSNDDKAASDFVNGILPADLVSQINNDANIVALKG